jgi:hypothetical protein
MISGGRYNGECAAADADARITAEEASITAQGARGSATAAPPGLMPGITEAAAPTGLMWLAFCAAVFVAVWPLLTLFNAVCRLVITARVTMRRRSGHPATLTTVDEGAGS